MPEHAEVKITSEFADKISEGRVFTHMTKSDVSKVKTELDVFDGKPFTIEAIARGKEMKLQLRSEDGDEKELMVFLGMSGTFINIRKNSPEDVRNKFLKHGHLRIHDADGNTLVFYDVRRFGKWKWVENGTWSSNRGYDPVHEHNMFKDDIINNYKTHKDFKSLVVHILMNQRWFNGIGNYLRSEILYRVPDVDPWTPFNQLSENQIYNIIQQCYECTTTAYKLQGGSFRDWKNPFGETKTKYAKVNEETMQEWRKIYGVKTSSYITDGTKRRFWFDPKWNSAVPEKYKRGKFLLKE